MRVDEGFSGVEHVGVENIVLCCLLEVYTVTVYFLIRFLMVIVTNILNLTKNEVNVVNFYN